MSCPFIPPVGFVIGKYLEIPSSSLVFLHSYFTTQTQRVVKDRCIQFAKIEKNNPPAKQMMSDCESGEALRPSSSLGLAHRGTTLYLLISAKVSLRERGSSPSVILPDSGFGSAENTRGRGDRPRSRLPRRSAVSSPCRSCWQKPSHAVCIVRPFPPRRREV